MGTNRWLSMTLVIAAALPWAISLGILGLWILLIPHPSGALALPRVSIPVGVSALAAAQLVFLMCIADRVFPKAPEILTRGIETALGAILLLSVVVLSVVGVGGGLG